MISKQEFYVRFLSLLCQIVTGSMSCPSVTGPWSNVRGSGAFITDQEFYATALQYLCQMSGGGGGAPTLGLTHGNGGPPEDGSVTTLIYKDDVSGFIFINTGTVASPTWDSI